MSDNADFSRLRYFRGLFLTAQDFTDEQEYHLRRRRRHNRGLHTPGVARNDLDGLRVRAVTDAGGAATKTIEVRPGMALDGEGREICLLEPQPLNVRDEDIRAAPMTVYVAISYAEEPRDRRANMEAGEFSGDARTAEIPRIEWATSKPDNMTQIELARISLQPGLTGVSDAADPAQPKGNEIDLRFVVYAGAVAAPAAADGLPGADRDRLILLMQRTRRDFAALAMRFPVPSAEDVRQAALTVELMVRAGGLKLASMSDILACLAAIEGDAGQELVERVPALARLDEYQAYQTALQVLQDALRTGKPLGELETAQDAVAQAARELSEVSLQEPAADAGSDQTMKTAGPEAAVTLDGSGSRAFGGRQISKYHWSLFESLQPPVANAGPSQTVTAATGTEEATVTLDASASQPSGGRTIRAYHWDESAS